MTRHGRVVTFALDFVVNDRPFKVIEAFQISCDPARALQLLSLEGGHLEPTGASPFHAA